MLAAYFIRLLYNRFIRSQSLSKKPQQARQKSSPFPTLRKLFFRPLGQSSPTEEVIAPIPQLSEMRHRNNVAIRKMSPSPISFKGPRVKQPFEVFLVLDIEGTCDLGTRFNYPNEIIELPVSMLRWKDRTDDSRASALELVEEFRTFVRPTWKPTLSSFCTQLTGITQSQVDTAPLFPEALVKLEAFLVKNGLIDAETGQRLVRFCWCSDGPFDIRDFIVKQCFISQIKMPAWFQGDVLDVKSLVTRISSTSNEAHAANRKWRSKKIPAQLKALGLPAFEGRQHSGIDDTRNIAKIVIELARRDVRLLPNTRIHPGRRWPWMGKSGKILEDYLN